MATVPGLASALSSWSAVFQGNERLVSAAVGFQSSNAAAASTLAAVAAQRVAASGGGVRSSFDGQFAAVATRIAAEDIPEDLREQLTNVAEDPQTLQAAAATVDLSAVPVGQKDRWVLELLIGYAFMIIYGFVQVGMTGDPVTPSLVMESIGAGGTGFATVKWAPGLKEKLRRTDASDG